MKKLKAVQVDVDQDGDYEFDTSLMFGANIPLDYWTSNGQYHLRERIEYEDVVFAMYCKEQMTDADIVRLRSAWQAYCPH